MRNGVEEEKEWSRWKYIFIVIILATYSWLYLLLPFPSNNCDCGTLDETLLLFKN
jgi:hypothetical protein